LLKKLDGVGPVDNRPGTTGNFLLVDLLTHPPPPPELLESPTVGRLSNNFRGGGGSKLTTDVLAAAH
jgi:hypothetical protein